jgi:hypothetical protein
MIQQGDSVAHTLTEDERHIIPMNGAAKTLTRLSAMDDLFAATGTVDVKVTRGNKETFVSIPIQSVDNEVVDALARPYRPKLPTRREMIDGQWKTVINEADPAYQDRIGEYNRINSYIWVFCALALDVVNEQGTLTWSRDNSVHDLEGTRAAMKRMGLVDNQLVAIMQAARNLTAITEGQQAGE